MSKSIWVIAGPTASGKSALAAQLAAAHDGVVINADSMQIYREIPILSAQPSAEETDLAPHLLYGFHPLLQNFSAPKWAAAVIPSIRDVLNQNKQPILVGGSGLYIQALTHGFAPMPAVSAATRKQVSDLYDMLGGNGFHAALAGIDPESTKRLHPSDRQRMIRAREIYETSGETLSAWQARPKKNPAPEFNYRAVILRPDRAWLHARINERFEIMVKQGAVDEARAINALDPDPLLTGTRALGLRALRDYCENRITLAEAIELGQTQSRQYAKRQSTWFKGQKISDDSVVLDKPDLALAQKYLHTKA